MMLYDKTKVIQRKFWPSLRIVFGWLYHFFHNIKQKLTKQKFDIEFSVSSNKAIINKNYPNIFHQLGISSEFRRIIFACSQHFACSIVKDLPSFTHTAFNASIVRISEFEQLQKLLTATSSWIENWSKQSSLSSIELWKWINWRRFTRTQNTTFQHWGERLDIRFRLFCLLISFSLRSSIDFSWPNNLNNWVGTIYHTWYDAPDLWTVSLSRLKILDT